VPAILRLSGRTGEHSGARRVGLEDLAGGARASPAVHGTGRGVRQRHRQRQRQRRREGVARGRTRAPRRAGRAGDALARAPQDARRPGGEKDSPLLFLCSSRLLAGEALEAVRLEDLRLLVLEEGAGGLFLPKPGPPPGSREATAFSVWRTRLVDALASPAVVDMTSARKPAAAARRERPLRR